MSPVVLLMGLLVLSYLGGAIARGRGGNMASGAEFLVLGFIAGPSVLGLVHRGAVASFDPLVAGAIGWLALLVGLDYGFLEGRRIRARSFLLGAILGAVTAAAVAAAVYVALRFFPPVAREHRLLVAASIGAACADTTRQTARWARDRHRARGFVTRTLAELADADDLGPLIATAFLLALRPTAGTLIALPFWGVGLLDLGLGVAFGAIAAALLGKEPRLHESWGVLLGTALLASGIAARVGLSPLAALFAMGVTVGALSSRARADLVLMVAPSERGVLLPVLLLAGARVDVTSGPRIAVVVVAALAARTVAVLVAGSGIARAVRPRMPPTLGLGLLSTGAVGCVVGLAVAMRFPGPVGDVVLATVALVTVAGELVGPTVLTALLDRAGEIPREGEAA